MTRLTLFILIVFSLISGACSIRKSKPDRKDLIPQKELVSILTDLYTADGLLITPKIHHIYSSLDSITSYYQVIEKHGYNKETMDRTMKYYFIKKPKKLIKIYDQVLAILSEKESLFEKEALLITSRIENRWTGKEFYSSQGRSGSDSAIFGLTLPGPGCYTLTFSATLFPDDQSPSPRMSIYTCNPDSLITGKKKYTKVPGYFKDGHLHTYTVTINIRENGKHFVGGWFYDFENPPDQEEHFLFENITFTYNPVPVQ